MFAVIKTGGKQYVVKEGDVLAVETLSAEAGSSFLFDQVLLIDDGAQTLIGTPVLDKAAVKADVVRNFKDDKILVFKKKRRKQFRRTRGHRQPLTEVRIAKIYLDTTGVSPEELAARPAEAEVQPKPKAPAKPKAVKKAPAEVAEKKPAKAAPKAAAKKSEKPKARAKKEKAAKPAPKPKRGTKKASK